MESPSNMSVLLEFLIHCTLITGALSTGFEWSANLDGLMHERIVEVKQKSCALIPIAGLSDGLTQASKEVSKGIRSVWKPLSKKLSALPITDQISEVIEKDDRCAQRRGDSAGFACQHWWILVRTESGSLLIFQQTRSGFKAQGPFVDEQQADLPAVMTEGQNTLVRCEFELSDSSMKTVGDFKRYAEGKIKGKRYHCVTNNCQIFTGDFLEWVTSEQ